MLPKPWQNLNLGTICHSYAGGIKWKIEIYLAPQSGNILYTSGRDKSEKNLNKQLTLPGRFDILSLVARENVGFRHEMRYAEVSELADELD